MHPDESRRMAELTTTTGEAIDIDAAAVTALADMDEETGLAVTCVFGIQAGPVRTAEPVSSVLERLHLRSKVAQLTRADASLVWFVGSAVTSLRAPLPDEYAPGVQCVVATTGLAQGCVESLQDARRALDAAGAHL
jgi:hypothetical protein